MSRKENLIRKSVYIPGFVNDYLIEQAEKKGLSQSSVISLALQEQMKQEKAIDSISSLDRLVEEIKKLKED